jgi:hypothetical protein
MGRAESIFQERARRNNLKLMQRLRPFTRRIGKREQELIDRKDTAQTAYLKSEAKAARAYYHYEEAQKALDQYRARKAKEKVNESKGSNRSKRQEYPRRSQSKRVEDSDARKPCQRWLKNSSQLSQDALAGSLLASMHGTSTKNKLLPSTITLSPTIHNYK